jgi:transcriptional regulator with XRE-family HTH domain
VLSFALKEKRQLPRLPRVKAIREAKFLSQSDLARDAGVSRTTVVRVESGEDATFSTARKLAKALGVEPQELLGE